VKGIKHQRCAEMAEVLTKFDRTGALLRLEDWRESDHGKAITKTFAFDDRNAAFGFMTGLAPGGREDGP
jgi:pterin-4a-carbinolamine dehydratase